MRVTIVTTINYHDVNTFSFLNDKINNNGSGNNNII